MISRRKSREFLLQALYAEANSSDIFERDIFFASFFEDTDNNSLDKDYFDTLHDAILHHQRELVDIIRFLAPKFDIATIPTLHIIILMIALSEILYFSLEKIPESVSVNEAIELAKKFSDESGKVFINGTLSTFLKDREGVLAKKEIGTFYLFT